MRFWYVRRGVAWPALVVCCGVAVVTALLVHRWPGTALVLLPAVLAGCAAAAAFLFDEPSASVVAVTPRGGSWRSLARLGCGLVPLSLWAALVVARPGDLPLSRPGWLLLGVATIALSAGTAALLSRSHPVPGPTLASLIVLIVLAPVVTFGFLDVPVPFPLSGFERGILGFWLALAAVAVLVCAAALRPPVRGWSARRA